MLVEQDANRSLPPPFGQLRADAAAGKLAHDERAAPTWNVTMNAGVSARIRLLVVDDHFFVRLGLACSLNAEPDMRVVAEADNGTQAIKFFREHQPDVVILDGRLPGLSGAETLTALRREFPKARVLMLSIDDGEENIQRALQAGAAGYLSKATQLQELLQAIRVIHAGERCFPKKAGRLPPHHSGGYGTGAGWGDSKSVTA